VRARAVLLAFTAALIGLGAIWFWKNFERVPERVWVGFQGEARRNPWLAAERLLARMGLSVRHVTDVAELAELPPRGTLILPEPRDAILPAERARLLQWIEHGGHLIVEDEHVRRPDPVLEALGVRRAAVAEPGAPSPIEVRLPHAPRQMRVEMHSMQTLDAPHASVRVSGKLATHLLHFPLGAGSVTVLNDLEFMRNTSIGAHDHAEFFWQITRFQPAAGAVFFFADPRRPSLWRWLAENAWAVLASGAVTLILWLWHAVPRFGPLAPDPEPTRRRLFDHLQASGRFQWSAGGGVALEEAAREAALRRVARAQADFESFTPVERAKRLASFDISNEDARRAIERAQSRTPHEFINAMRVFQRIHERLIRHSAQEKE
jgi:Domain of unknown function (DUF4350)